MNPTIEWFKYEIQEHPHFCTFLHCEDGPAAFRHGKEEYWLYGERLSKVDWEIAVLRRGTKVGVEEKPVVREVGFRVETTRWGTFYYLDGQLHREDGPAVERNNGDRQWYQRGLLHRIDGPAIIHTNGYQAWAENGRIIKSENHF